MKHFVICENDCLVEGMTKEEIISAIAKATGYVPTEDDEAFINQIINQNNGAGVKLWLGTRVEYNALAEKDANTIYHITDDKNVNEAYNIAVKAVSALNGCRIDFSDENGNPTEEPYLHWDVDENGNPVAPSIAVVGEDENYELIEEITLEEATMHVIRNTEPNGTPYCFSAIFVHIFLPANATLGDSNINCDDTLFSLLFHRWFSTSTKTTDSSYYYHLFKDKGLWTTSAPIVNSFHDGLEPNHTTYMNDAKAFANDKNIGQLRMAMSGNGFPIGAVITIYGVRA